LWFDTALAGALPLAAAGVEPDSPTHPDRRAAWTDAVSRTRVAGRPAAGATPGAEHPDLQLEAFVHRRVADLAHRCTTDDDAAAASLGRLRRAVDREPRSDPMIWPDTLAGLPQALIGRGDRPSRYERAAHSAITLFAVHQQARTTSMHRDGIGLGRAVYRLGGQDFSGQVTLRRFQAVATASSYPDTIHHLRGLITQLRSAGVGLDYGLLARDLARLQSPRSADSVRLTWGRGYHWRPENDDEVPATGDPASAATT